MIAAACAALACDRGEKPLATYGDTSVMPGEFLKELDHLLEDGRSLADMKVSPETLLRRVVRLKLLADTARERVGELNATDQGRLELFQERLMRDELLAERYPDPIVIDATDVQARYETLDTTVPLELKRAEIEAELREVRRQSRERDFEAELLDAAAFATDSATVALVARRFAAHYDSLTALGTLGADAPLPLFTTDEKAHRFFTVFGQAFTVQALLDELVVAPPQRWKDGEAEATLRVLARRRALSIVLTALAQQRGLFQRPDIAEKIDRKRSEMRVNTLLRDVWQGIRPTDEDARQELAIRGLEDPSPSDIAAMRDAIVQQRRFDQMQAFLVELENRHEVVYYPERLAAVLEERSR